MHMRPCWRFASFKASPPSTCGRSGQVRPILRVGSPVLYQQAAPVKDPGQQSFLAQYADLAATLQDFRRTSGFGRAIAAPQIGISRRFIAMNLHKPGVTVSEPGSLTWPDTVAQSESAEFAVVNPVMRWTSKHMFTMWDDCLSFPEQMAMVQRHSSISVSFVDQCGREHHWRGLDQATSELFQHEMDHLDGVLAVDRELAGVAVPCEESRVIRRSEYLRRRGHYDSLVDYSILAQ
eukprot:TRINITY_DN55661_c0_g1_i1.p1 TRINITY_DN55661_c0_g1~~TRINITY_DN55661_c0_g1_i1.p1  ORF type:complete len:235 (+),score=35.38 TRINITY_DN55661_c0_g1_i1:189-893(+)